MRLEYCIRLLLGLKSHYVGKNQETPEAIVRSWRQWAIICRCARRSSGCCGRSNA